MCSMIKTRDRGYRSTSDSYSGLKVRGADKCCDLQKTKAEEDGKAYLLPEAESKRPKDGYGKHGEDHVDEHIPT